VAAITAEEMHDLVARALAEDLGDGDVTSEATVSAERTATARIVQKAPGVVFGLDLVVETMAQTGVEEVETTAAEGEWSQDVPVEVLVARGSARSILAAERTALNFLGHLSGVATLTARYVEAVAGTKARILDTRKTTPGLRKLEKAAVAAGGGTVRRIGLFDAFLIKENHIAAAGSIPKAVYAARKAHPELSLEVEVRNLDEAAYALGTGADELLLDNMDPPTLRAAVELRDANSHDGGKPSLEASGNVNLETVRAVAESGVDFISVGALTHSAPVLDFSLLLSVD
jgi:nicotinate-nucleotide pyrophosphorylase (carboxylating)